MTDTACHHDEMTVSPYPEVDEALRRCRFRDDALIEVLHGAQERYGCLTRPLLGYVAQRLALPLSLVYGVASFYHFFTLEPKGRHHCTVCTGTSCHIKGGTALLAELERRFGISCGTTSTDGAISLSAVRCLGVCGMAPLVELDGAILGGTTPAQTADAVCEQLAQSGTWSKKP